MPDKYRPSAAMGRWPILIVSAVLGFGLALAGYALSQSSQTESNPLAGCTMCHVDVEDEFLGSRHFQKEIGCTQCHGASDGHIADENNDVKPDGVFNRENVERLCLTCHECGSQSTSPSASDAAAVCTDCHGYHDQRLLQSGDE